MSKTEIEKLLDRRDDLEVCELLIPEQCAMCINESGDCVHVTVENGELVLEVQ